MSTTNRSKELFIKGTALITAILCLCATISFLSDTYYSGKAKDLAKAMFAAFYTIYFVIVTSDGD